MLKSPSQKPLPARPHAPVASSREQVMSAIRNHPDLPSLPGIAVRIFAKANDPDAQVTDIANIISQEPALCARMLRLANSALYGFRQPIASLSQAVSVLGVNRIRSLVLSLSVSDLKTPALPPHVLCRHWRDSLCGALAAQELARRLRPALAEHAFVMGLVRDLGIVVLGQLFPDRYLPILESPRDSLIANQCELEDRAVQIDHALVSADLLLGWRIPEEIAEPVRHHHNWPACDLVKLPLRERARLLYLASRLGNIRSLNDTALLNDVCEFAATHFTLKPDQIAEVYRSAQSKLGEIANLFRLDIGSDPA